MESIGISNRLYVIIISGAAFTASILIIAFLAEIISFSHRMVSAVFLKSEQNQTAFGLKATSHLKELKRKMDSLSALDKCCFLPVTSFFVWLTTYVMFYVVMWSMEVKLSFTENVLASSAAVVTNFLPVNGLGSFGTLEAGWAAGYMLVGVKVDDAIISGFIMHLIVVMVGLILALISVFYLKKNT
jgi:uncharacterized membrane protein YbhN (UPF0104 family)